MSYRCGHQGKKTFTSNAVNIISEVTLNRTQSWNKHCYCTLRCFNKLRPRQNCHRFADDIFKCIFLNENVSTCITIKISLKFAPKGPINNNPALVQIMAWRQSGDKPLSEPMMASLLTHICVTLPQWVKGKGSAKQNIACMTMNYANN